MPRKSASPSYSAGARYERAALRNYLTRTTTKMESGSEYDTLMAVLRWVQGRQKRYDTRPGGL